jgi:hypothetical protein
VNSIAIIEPRFQVTVTGLQVTGQPSWEQWVEYGRDLVADYNRLKWQISDWLAYGDDAFGDDIYQIVDEIWQPQTIANYTSTARRIPPSERRPDVVFSIHSEVASLDAVNRKHALDMVASKQWNRDDVREYKRNLKGLPLAVEQTITLRYTDIVYQADKIIVVFDKPIGDIIEFKAVVSRKTAPVNAESEAA